MSRDTSSLEVCIKGYILLSSIYVEIPPSFLYIDFTCIIGVDGWKRL